MTKILIIISLITGLISATVQYFSEDTTQQKIEQLKDVKNNDKI